MSEMTMPPSVGELHDRRDVLGRRREHDEVREGAKEREPVGLVHQELVRIRQHRAGPEERLELLPEVAFTGSRQRHA